MNAHTKKKILLVEDEIFIALATRKLLESEDYSIEHVFNGETATELVKSKKFDLILMDIDLGPGMDGIETAESILSKFSVPILFLSSHSETDIIDKIERTTSYGYVVKGNNFNVLNTSIKMALKLFAANKKTEQNENKYRHLIDISPIPYALNDTHQNIVHLNKAFITTFGYDLKDIPTLADWWPKAYPDKDYRNWIAATWAERLQKAQSGSLPFEPMELKIRCKDNTEKIVIASVSLLDEESPDTHLVILYEITESKVREESVRRNTQLLENSQSIAKVGGWELDIRTGELFWTTETYHIHEVSPEELNLTMDVAISYFLPDSKKKITDALELAIEEGLNFDLELESYTAKGKVISIRTTCVATPSNGKPTKLTGIFQDITEQKQKEETIKNLLAEKEVILKEIHHRIKNNMNTVSSLINIQADMIEDSKVKEILFDASARVHSMMILYDKLYISKTQNLVSLHVYLPSLLNEIKNIFPVIQNIEIKTDVEDIALTPKFLSPLGIIFNELITNSMKYGFKDRLVGTIHVSGRKLDDHITLTYSDDGPGYPDSISFQNSSGFGLQLIQMLIDQINGVIKIVREEKTLIQIDFKI
jgi:PAS domain S-box-containing protein